MPIGFVTLDEANTYASSILTKTWTTITDPQKTQSLQSAYNTMLSYSNLYDYSDPTLQCLKDAQCELAIYLWDNLNSQAVINIQQGITQKTVGNTSESYDTVNAGRYQKIPEYIFLIMTPVYIGSYTTTISNGQTYN